MEIVIYADGGSRGNPGPSGCGIFLCQPDGTALERRYRFLGETTNNVAEYTGALLGLQRAFELGASRIELRMDSKLVIEQLSGRWKVKDEKMRELFTQIRNILSLHPEVQLQFTHIPREKNAEADRLANKAMDEAIRNGGHR